MTASSPPDHACFIIHSHRPYCFDFNEILALPEGFRYRNRFDSQWLEVPLRQGVGSLIGRKVLIILRDIDKNRLIPVRWGNLFSAQMVGKIAYFEYHLAELVNYSSEPNVALQEIVARTDQLAIAHHWLPGAAGRPLDGPSVFVSGAGTNLPVKPAADLSAWGNAVSAVATAPVFARIEFLKIVELAGPDGRPALVKNESFVVRANSVYTLRVFQHVPAPGAISIPQHSIELSSFESHITALRSKQRAVGKYDMLTFVLKVKSLAPGERTALEIPHVPDAATSASATTSLYLPLAVRGPNPIILALSLLVLAGSLLFMFWPTGSPLPEATTRNIATILFVITLAGPSRTLAGIWPSWPWRFDR